MHVPRPLNSPPPTHCATPSTVPLATPTQSAYNGTIGTEVCRSLILKMYIRLVSCRKYKMNNSKRRIANLFYIHNKTLHVSTDQCHRQYSSTECIDRIQLF